MAKDQPKQGDETTTQPPDNKSSETPQPPRDPTAKQGVINPEDVKTGKKFKVGIRGVRGEVAGARFGDDCVAQDVTEETLSRLQRHFGARAVRVMAER